MCGGWVVFVFPLQEETKINLQAANIFLHSEDTSGPNLGSWPDGSH